MEKTIAGKKNTRSGIDWKEVLHEDGQFLRQIVQDFVQELCWLYDRRDLQQARLDLVASLKKWQQKYPRLCYWVDSDTEETLSFHRLPRQHHKRMKLTNMLEPLNEEMKRWTRVVGIFPDRESCLRLIRALATETEENWIEATRYLNMTFLREKKESLGNAAA